MNKPLLIAKSALIENELDNKIFLQAEAIEIQLLDELAYTSAKALFNRNKKLFFRYPIKAIHAPLMDSHEVSLEYIRDTKYVKKTCELAELCGKLRNEKIIVVLHVYNSTDTLRELGRLNYVVSMIRQLADKYEHIKIGIENTTIFDLDNDEKRFGLDSTISIKDGEPHLANIDLVKEINHPRVGCVIDFCHLLMTERVTDLLVKWLQRKGLEQKDFISTAFKEAAPYTILYHLAYPKSTGYNIKSEIRHGMPFHKDDEKEMKLLQSFMDNYNMSCKIKDEIIPITLEVFEYDYNNCKNFRDTKFAVESII